MIPFIVYEMSRISTSIKTESKLMIARGWEEQKMGVTANRYKVCFGMAKTL